MIDFERLQNPFHSVTSICRWAGTENGILWFGKDMPYIQVDGMFYYFGKYEDNTYQFVLSFSKDLSGEQA